jgi:hypothetical protein
MTIQRILSRPSAQNTTSRLDMVVLPHNIRPGRITLYTTSLYVLEQCSMFKTYATLSLEGTIYIRPRYPNIFDVKNTTQLLILQLNHDDSATTTLYGGGGYIVEDGNMLKPRVPHFPSRVHNYHHPLNHPQNLKNDYTC